MWLGWIIISTIGRILLFCPPLLCLLSDPILSYPLLSFLSLPKQMHPCDVISVLARLSIHCYKHRLFVALSWKIVARRRGNGQSLSLLPVSLFLMSFSSPSSPFSPLLFYILSSPHLLSPFAGCHARNMQWTKSHCDG